LVDQLGQRLIQLLLAAVDHILLLQSVEKLMRCNWGPDDSAPRMSQVYAAHPTGPWIRCNASAIGYNTTREPQNTQARWLTEPATLCFSQSIANGKRPCGGSAVVLQAWQSLVLVTFLHTSLVRHSCHLSVGTLAVLADTNALTTAQAWPPSANSRSVHGIVVMIMAVIVGVPG
jgi:hypothetical protein